MNILHEWFDINKWGDISLVFITQYNINTFLFFYISLFYTYNNHYTYNVIADHL